MTNEFELNPEFDRTYTLDEFLTSDFPDDADEDGIISYELVEGKLIARLTERSGTHGRIRATIGSYLYLMAGKGAGKEQIGTVYIGATCTFSSPSDEPSWVEPDISFVANGRTPADFEGPVPVAPDLVVEIWLPTDTTEIIQNKIEAYQNAGVRLIWSVYHLGGFVIVHRLNNPNIEGFNSFSGELDGGDVMPGFRIKVSQLFQ